jgi:hypothetical protein
VPSFKSMWLLVLVTIGCSGAGAFLGPGHIDGRWSEGFSNSGSSLEINLTSTGTTVSGSGNFCGEAGPCGSVAVAGTVDGIAVHLELTLTQQLPQAGPARIEHFDGRFTSSDTLQGSITTDMPGQLPGQTGFHRVTQFATRIISQ